ncbi:Heterogeneous nuclear ribonucleoprotein f-like [Quillaja saponaria]|uniref:Heterogeneous nuclear ribonucleoprotein f-like n=1 Tax=Quillaja saponaria TaxID=32244 RepID=A0AAD7L8R9_QUISA|nr:Heterogeneous nuclear ribonucleoprotein f-like [Quillaja saponaria]KAJ7953223.1 Heterogeneous nuclear ribonucleoprotein f-like [Quillaja saponaria]
MVVAFSPLPFQWFVSGDFPSTVQILTSSSSLLDWTSWMYCWSTKVVASTGEAFVVFAGSVQVELALHRDRQNMGRRYVEVFRSKRQDYYHAVAAEVNYEGIYDNDYHGSPPPSRSKRFSDKDQMEYTEILKMRGLPFSVKKSEILEFFGDFKLVEERLHIACRPDGKATGEAFVEFVSADEAKRAMCRDKMTIGSRYVELFPSTQDEARRAESRSRQ